MSNEKTYEARLFENLSFAGLKLKNRIVRAATFEKRADENGAVTDDLIEFYRELAKGGAALLITGGALVHPTGRTLRQMLSAHADSFTDGLGKLADVIRLSGALSALQLFHGGRHCSPRVINWEVPLAPSEVRDTSSDTTPRAMTDSEIWTMVDSFASAAFRAQSAGFDAVEIHAAHGYLISSFLSPRTNLRDDYWGGDEARRAHFLEEILKAVREAVGHGYPVIVKLNAEDQMEGGITEDEAARIALLAEHAGADAIEISGGTRESDPPILRKSIQGDEPEGDPEGYPEGCPEGYYKSAGRLMKDTLGVPVILTGGFRTLKAMEGAIGSKEADMIGLGRPLICEPELPLKLQEGVSGSKCTSCNKCSRYSRIDAVRCVEKF